MSQRLLVLTAAVLLLAGIPAAAKDNAIGPWNIEASASTWFETNSNVFYEEDNPEADQVLHLIPALKIQYEQLKNVIFEAELKLNSYTYFGNSDANIVETLFHAEFRPVKRGAYLLFAEDYQLRQNYSPTDGLVDTSYNSLIIGGGFRGYHLDAVMKAVMKTTGYLTGGYSDLDNSETTIEADVEYLFESLYVIGGLSSGSINYADSAFNDGNSFAITAGVGKKFYPKNSIEFTVSSMSQKHDGGDDFSGLLYSLELLHITQSRKGSVHLTLEKELKPSTVPGSDYTELMFVRVYTDHYISRHIAMTIDGRFEVSSIGDRDDRVVELALRGRYTPIAVLPRKGIVRKPLKPFKPWKYHWRVEFGVITKSRASDVSEYEFSQFRAYAGMKFVY